MGELVQKLSYTHEAMVEMILTDPTISQGDLARKFGYTEGWISRLIASDGFQALLHKKKTEFVDPIVTQSLDVQLRGLAMQSLNVVRSKLDAAPTLDAGVKVLELSTKALGYGARGGGDQNNVQINNYVVNVPPKASNPKQWLESNSPGVIAREHPVPTPTPLIIDAEHTGNPPE